MKRTPTKTQQNWLYRPTFPSRWIRRSLYSMATWINGLAFSNIEFSPIGRPVIKIAEIKRGISNQTKYTKQVFDESVWVRSGDLLFSWSGQPETSIDSYWYSGPEGWLNQHIYRVTPQTGIDRNFFFYLLRYLRPNFIAIAQNKQTTGLGHVTKKDLKEIEVALPTLDEQRSIGRILKTLDEKSELNRRMNETLEAIVHAIFESWFIEFQSVDSRTRYLELSSGKLTRDDRDFCVDTRLGRIPRDWKVGCLSDISFSPLRGVDPQSVNATTPYIGLEHLPRRSIAIGNWGRAGTVTSKKFEFKSREILFGKICPGSFKVGLAPVSGICSTDVVVVNSKNVDYFPFVLALVSSEEFVHYTDQTSTGTIMPRTSWKTMGGYPICIPPISVARQFRSMVDPILDRIDVNIGESRTLDSLRTALVPRLISGELSVGSAMQAIDSITTTGCRAES